MKIILMLACVLLSSFSHISNAETSSAGYWLNSSGNIINFNGFCIHTGEWTPEIAVRECDPDTVAENLLQNAPALAPTTSTKPSFNNIKNTDFFTNLRGEYPH
jgi:hypothetical protein